MNPSLNEEFLKELSIELRDLVTPDESEMIRQEMAMHIEERREHLLSMGLSEAEAAAAAIAAMGSPAEIAKPYASVHSPGRKLNVVAIILGLLSALFFYIELTYPVIVFLPLLLSVVFGLTAVVKAAQGSAKGFALTLGRMANFTGWVTMLALINLLTQFFPEDAKVASIIHVKDEVKGTTLYRAPITGRLVSLAEGPTKDTAYLIITNETAAANLPPLPVKLHSQYQTEAKMADARFKASSANSMRASASTTFLKAGLIGLITAVFCGAAYLLSRLLRARTRSKQPPIQKA